MYECSYFVTGVCLEGFGRSGNVKDKYPKTHKIRFGEVLSLFTNFLKLTIDHFQNMLRMGLGKVWEYSYFLTWSCFARFGRSDFMRDK